MSFSFSGVIKKIESVLSKLKTDVAKAAQDADGVAVKLEADAPEIEAVANAALPGAGTVVQNAIGIYEKLCGIIDAGDAAAEQNLKNAGLDETAISTIKTDAAAIKKLA